MTFGELVSGPNVQGPRGRALSDITSGPEARQIFKIRTVRKPDVFLPRCRTSKNRKKKSKKKSHFFYYYLFGLRTFDIKFVSRDLILWELITCIWQVKCLKILNWILVRQDLFGKFGCPSCPVEPYNTPYLNQVYAHNITTYPLDFETFLRPWLDLSLDLKAIFCSTSVSFCESTFLLLVL